MKRFAAGNIITWVGVEENTPPIGISIGRYYKVEFVHRNYSNAILNDNNEYTFNFNGFVDIEEYLWSKHKVRRGSEVQITSSDKKYIIEGFDAMITEVLVNLKEVK